MIRRILNLITSSSFDPEPGDIVPGDLARKIPAGRVGLVESVKGDTAVIAYGKDSRSILPVSILRKVRRDGDELDKRGK